MGCVWFYMQKLEQRYESKYSDERTKNKQNKYKFILVFALKLKLSVFFFYSLTFRLRREKIRRKHD